jgi:serine/threonine protein kinase
VYKQVSRENKTVQDWAKRLNEANILRQRRHKYITPLLASFRAGWEKASGDKDVDTAEVLYMISPRAVEDMKEWMSRRNSVIRHDEIYEAMLGLVSALTYIHKELGGEVVFHHDIKPANILRFEENGPIWKICDFGSSNVKPVDDTMTQHAEHTRSYAPPEYFLEGKKSGRAADVFSLGCVFLELGTILRYGWGDEGLCEFEKLRKNNDEGMRGYREYDFRADESYWRNMNVVRVWVRKLRSERGSRLEQVMELVEEMLSARDERVFAWEVDVDLFEILNPDRPETDSLQRLRDNVQKSNKSINGLDTRHNPLSRAKRKRRSSVWLDILMRAEWRDYTPGATTHFLDRTTGDVPNYFSTLSLSSVTGLGPNYGRHDLDKRISETFGKVNRVALYGLGGIGYVLI